LERLGVSAQEVRNPIDLNGVTHLIIPGGESTTIRKVAQANGLWSMLKGFKGPVMGTCMGSILMARKILSPDSDGWGMIDMTIRRNAYGRQISSFTALGKLSFSDKAFEMIFIRAPKITSFNEKLESVAWLNDEVTGVRSGNKLALTFHPELSGNNALHKYFLELS